MVRMRPLRCSRLAWVTMVLLAGGRLGAAAEQAHATHAVTIENMQFTPAQLTVHPGDRIVFSNKDLFPHTVTADDGSFDSHSIAPNATWSYRAKQAGKHAYKCSFHPTMTGALIVQ